MAIDRNTIRNYLDEINIPTRVDDDGDLVVVNNADDEFVYNIVIFIMVNNNRLSYTAGAPDYTPKGDIYMLANRHNASHYMPMAVVRDGNLRMEYSFLLDEEVSKEYIIENCIKYTLGSIVRAFADFEKSND